MTFFTQGCPHRCAGCHNPETWDFNGGMEFHPDLIKEIVNALTDRGIKRNLCIMGGEPLCPENEFLTCMIVRQVKEALPDVEIYLWSGYTYEQLSQNTNPHVKYVMANINCLIDGPYLEEERDITLPMRGSRNQRVIKIDKSEKI